MLWRY